MQQEVKAILTAEDRGYTSTMKNAQNVTETFGQKIKSGLGFGVLMRAGQKAFDVIGNAISTNLAGATKRFDTLNNYPKVMQSLGFSAEQAEKSINTLGDSIAHLPTTLDKVASQTQQVVAVTGDLDKATELTLALNNAMAGGGASAEQQASAINQWVQAMSKGKPDLMDWRSMVQTAPAQMDQLSKALLGAEGNQTKLYEAMQKGEITIDQVNDKMIELSKNGGEGFASWEEQAKSAGGGINMALTNIKAGIQRNIANVLDAVNKRFEKFGGIAGVMESIIAPINAIGDAISGVINGELSFEDAINNLLTSLSAKLPEFIKKGADMVLNLASGIAQALPQLIVKGLNAITSFVQGLGNGDGQLINKAFDIVVKLVGGLIKNLPQIISAGVKLILALLQGITSAFGTLLGKLGGLVKKIPTAIKSGLGNLTSIGKNLITGLWNGIKSAFDSTIAKVKALASKLPSAVKKVLGIHSPSRVFAEIGMYTGEGFALGIERSYRQVQGAMGGLYSLQPAGALGGSMSLSDDYSYNSTARYEVIVPVQLNGREIARASASDMQTALNQRETRQSRKVGIR
jgi:tape measure domain-containing protein